MVTQDQHILDLDDEDDPNHGLCNEQRWAYAQHIIEGPEPENLYEPYNYEEAYDDFEGDTLLAYVYLAWVQSSLYVTLIQANYGNAPEHSSRHAYVEYMYRKLHDKWLANEADEEVTHEWIM